jgi:putative ABC transport system permease protein
MLRHAWSEVRFHPGRFVSTILAIAISVAFLGGSSVFVATEGRAMGRALNVAIAAADLVVSAGDEQAPAGVRDAIAAVPGVAAVAPVLSLEQVVSTDLGSEVLHLVNLPPDSLRWAKLTAGRWPSAADEVALSAGAASALKVVAGGMLHLAGTQSDLRVVGLTDEPSTLFAKTGYAPDAAFLAAGIDPAAGGAQWSVKLAPGRDASAVQAGVATAVHALGAQLSVEPAAAVQERAIASIARDFNAFTFVLWGFAAIALVVGMITIANTFTITLAQRRRQIGLLRAVGASGGQVRGRFLAESVLLGVIGSLVGVLAGIGIAAAAAAWTGSLFWGLSLPAPQLLIALGLGVVATTAAAWVPIVRGTRVAPLEALQPVPTVEQARRASVGRAVACGLLLVAGGGLATIAVLFTIPGGFLVAIAAGMLIALGVLFGGPLFVPGLLAVSGRLIRWAGPTPRLAADNAERNPRRATATATALMLAVGLVVTLQVGTASIRATVLDQIHERFPVDVSVAWSAADGSPASAPGDLVRRLQAAQGVARSVSLRAGTAEVGGDTVRLLGWDPAIPSVTGQADAVSERQVLVQPYVAKRLGATVAVAGAHGRLTLAVVASNLVAADEAMVSAANLDRLGAAFPAAEVWLSVPDRSRAVGVITEVTAAVGSSARIGGGLAEAATYEQVLGVLLAITTALLAVAVVIALIGVSNTLGLSVLERTRESALLRALGLQARSLRWMLTVEALLLTLVAVAIGVLAGTFFGWLAVASLARSNGFPGLVFTVDLPQTTAMVGVAVVAAALASVLPGRRAAKAAPTEALADI